MWSLQRFWLAHRAVEPEVLAEEVAALVCPEQLAHLQRLIELRQPDGRGREWQAIHPVLGFGVPSTQAELQPTTRDHVERRGHLREHGWVAVAHARDERTDANT